MENAQNAYKQSNYTNSNNVPNSRFHVAIRVRPELGDERNELTTEDDLSICVKKVVKILLNFFSLINKSIWQSLIMKK